jgi:hypothetical protein
MTDIWVGRDRESGEDVRVPLGHLAIFGQTRRAGKTTSLRTLLEHADADALIFRTGRGEVTFGGRPFPPYFRERLDWQGVEAMLWSYLAEKPKVYRPLIMRAVRGARSLAEVHTRIVAEGKKSKNGWVVDRTYELDTYFQSIRPWIEEHRLTTEWNSPLGPNVLDMEGWPITVKQLVIAAVMDRLMEVGRRDRPLLLVLPEAKEFIPNDRATPVKLAADRLVRMGAKLNLFLWIDSQALTGVDQQVLRNFALLLQGVQTSDIEIRRVAKALEVPPRLVRELKVGDFILHTDGGSRVIHVPLSEKPTASEETSMDEKKEQEYRDRIRTLEKELASLTADLERERERAEQNAWAAAESAVDRIGTSPTPGRVMRELAESGEAPRPGSFAEAMGSMDAGAAEEHERVDLHVRRETPNLTVHVVEKRIDARPDSHEGKLAILLAEGFFDEKKSTGPIAKEYAARGWGAPTGGNSAAALRAALETLCGWGFLRAFKGLYGVVPEAKTRIHVVKGVTRP